MKLVRPDYTRSILNVTTSILHYYGAPVAYPTLPELDEALSTHRPDHVIYVLLDGLGINAIERHLQPSDAIRNHLLTPITSVFPPTTVAATDAVLSGLPPIVNGHVGWVQYFKEENANVIVFQNKDYYKGTIYAEDLRQKYLAFDTIYDQINAAAPDVLTKEFFPAFREGGSESFAEQVERVLISTHNTDRSFNYVYWIEPDLVEHQHGVDSEETAHVIHKLNEDFTALIDNLPERTMVVLIADHGLVDVEQMPLFQYDDVMSLLSQQPSIEPRTTTFFVKDGMQDAFEERFNKHFGTWFKLYRTADFLATKLLGEGPMNPNLAQCFGNFVSVATDKYMFTLHEGKAYKAHHAGLSEAEMMVPLVLYAKK